MEIDFGKIKQQPCRSNKDQITKNYAHHSFYVHLQIDNLCKNSFCAD